ncbi:protein of unknown function [Candidatus Nitrosocosmicus franklandus]|uniref:Uncharacterized protein n=1 Tax=Candidatus Nitrosocosmicus franklandianus TaxID=1798806 RepID=A0A484IA83_9ARCH|nr:protein of unknown function [Candidatus Nitrosocosmicus franklandus]
MWEQSQQIALVNAMMILEVIQSYTFGDLGLELTVMVFVRPENFCELNVFVKGNLSL